MADVLTGPDSLRFYHSGASSDGGSQSDESLSLGNYRAGDEIQCYEDVTLAGGTEGTIDFIAGFNGEGTGNIKFEANDKVYWKGPNNGYGSAVTIAQSETKVVIDDSGSSYIRFTRTQAGNFSDRNEDITLTAKANNLIGIRDTTEDDCKIDHTIARCIVVKNVHASDDLDELEFSCENNGTYQISDAEQLPATGAGLIGTSGSFATWPASGWACVQHLDLAGPSLQIEIVYYFARTASELFVSSAGRGRFGTMPMSGSDDDNILNISGILLGMEAPSAQPDGYFTNISEYGEYTRPAGVDFPTITLGGFNLSVGTLSAGEIYALWILHDCVPGQSGLSKLFSKIICGFLL